MSGARIVALGDSITYGWLDGGGRAVPWTAELARPGAAIWPKPVGSS